MVSFYHLLHICVICFCLFLRANLVRRLGETKPPSYRSLNAVISLCGHFFTDTRSAANNLLTLQIPASFGEKAAVTFATYLD